MTHLAKRVAMLSGCVLGLLGAGCSPSNSAGVDATPVPLDQFPARFASVVCDTVGPCCKSAGIAHDSASCKSAATMYFQAYVAESGGPGKTYDAAVAGRCLSAAQAALQSCINFDDNTTGVACANIFTGIVPLGGACASDSDCAPGGSCSSDPNDPTRALCVAARNTVHAKAGEACSGNCSQLRNGEISCTTAPIAGADPTGGIPPGSSPCYASDGLFCSSRTHICGAFAQIGQACDTGSCASGAFCDLGKCTAQLDSGPCTGTSDACSVKSYCDGPSEQCVPRLADGSPCTFPDECLSDECSETADPNKRACGAPTAATPALCAGQLN